MNREQVMDALADIRDIIHGVHDKRVATNRGAPLSSLELAALRDCGRRLNDAIDAVHKLTEGKS